MQTSVSERLIGVFTHPGSVFKSIKGVEFNSVNFIAPLIITIISIIIFNFTVFSQERVIEKMREMQDADIERQLEKGGMNSSKKEMMKKVKDLIDKIMNPDLMMVIASASDILGTPISWVIHAFIFHWIARISSRSYIPFSKCFEVISLSSVVSILGTFVNMFLVLITGNIQTNLSLSLIFEDSNSHHTMYNLAHAIDVISIWYLCILSVALSSLTNHPIASCAAWFFGLWLAFVTVKAILF